MQVVNQKIITGKKILLRYDIDVALKQEGSSWIVGEEFKLKAGLETVKLCIQNATKVIIMGHLGRPFATAEDERKGNPQELSAKPIKEWLEKTLEQSVDFAENLEQAASSNSKVILLENIRFFHGEEMGSVYHAICTSKTCDVDFAKRLASLGDFYINEAFSSYRPAVSTTVLPTLLPHAVGLHFIKEVETLLNVRNNPKKPFIAVIGGAKVSEKVDVIKVLAKNADAVLVGGKLIHEIREQQLELPKNVMVGKLTEDGFDVAEETVSAWKGLISKAEQIVWNGPVGKVQSSEFRVQRLGSERSSYELAKAILETKAKTVIGGGDIIAFLSRANLLEQFESHGFVSVGGGAMLKLLSDGTLPTIEALN